MKTTAPKIDERSEQPYVGIRSQISMGEMGSGIIPQLHDEVLDWLNAQDVKPSGPPFMRYHVINMPDYLDVELAWPVEAALTGEGRIEAGLIPAGRYASLIYTDVAKGVEGNGALIVWAEENGLEWDRWDDEKGDAFRARIEFYLTDPDDDPDPSNWETEVAIKLAD